MSEKRFDFRAHAMKPGQPEVSIVTRFVKRDVVEIMTEHGLFQGLIKLCHDPVRIACETLVGDDNQPVRGFTEPRFAQRMPRSTNKAFIRVH